MKQFILIASIALLASCGLQQEPTTLETSNDTTVTDTTVTCDTITCDTVAVDSVAK